MGDEANNELLQHMTALGDYWHDQYNYHDRMARLALENMELFAEKVQALAQAAGHTAVELASIEPPNWDGKLRLIQGGRTDGIRPA